MGARPLRRAIQRYIEDKLADAMLERQFGPGTIVMVDARRRRQPADGQRRTTPAARRRGRADHRRHAGRARRRAAAAARRPPRPRSPKCRARPRKLPRRQTVHVCGQCGHGALVAPPPNAGQAPVRDRVHRWCMLWFRSEGSPQNRRPSARPSHVARLKGRLGGACVGAGSSCPSRAPRAATGRPGRPAAAR